MTHNEVSIETWRRAVFVSVLGSIMVCTVFGIGLYETGTLLNLFGLIGFLTLYLVGETWIRYYNSKQ